MKNAIAEYLNISEAEKAEMWDNAVFVFDTNVYLDLYRFTKKTSNTVIAAMEKYKERIWMPYQVAYEFMKNRISIIFESESRYTKLHSGIDSVIKKYKDQLRLSEDTDDITKLRAYLSEWLEARKSEDLAVSDPANDQVLEKLLELYDGKVGECFSKEELANIYTAGKERYEKLIPPGYMDKKKQTDVDDNNLYGDFIIWKEILEFSKKEKKDILLVTNDTKEDWWDIVEGKKQGPRVELKKEFMQETGMRFHIYQLKNFINIYNKAEKVDETVIEEIESVHNQESRVYDDYVADSIRLRASLEAIDKKIEQLSSRIKKIDGSNKKRVNQIIAYNKHYPNDKEVPEYQKRQMLNTIEAYNKNSDIKRELEKSLFEQIEKKRRIESLLEE